MRQYCPARAEEDEQGNVHVDYSAPLHQGQLRSVVGNSPIMGGDPTIGGNPTTGWYSTQHLVGILTIFTIDAI